MPRLSDEPALNTPTLTVPAAGWSEGEEGSERAGGRAGWRRRKGKGREGGLGTVRKGDSPQRNP